MRKNKNSILLIIQFVIGISISVMIIESCQHDSEIIHTIPEICFEREVLPIFQNSCALSGCHNTISAQEGYIFDSYANIIKAVDPGNSDNSKAYTSLINIYGEIMPPDQPLSLENRTIIRVWIEQGAKNTICPDTTSNDSIINPQDTATWVNPRVCFTRDILPLIRGGCAISGCHDAITAEGERVLTNYTNIANEVRPGDPLESDLYQKIVENDPNDRMPPPPYDPLTRAQIDSIYNWILNGALNEYCGYSCDTISEITFSEFIWPIVNLNCRSCHSGTNPSGSQYLRDYTDLAAIAADGRLKSVIRGNGFPLMPPEYGLSDCNIRQIEIWIENGFQNN